MKTIHKILLGLILISAINFTSCDTGVGAEIDNGTGSIRIVSISPVGPYNDGTSYDFTVQVAYTLENTDDAEIIVGFGERDSDGSSSTTHSAEEIVTPTAIEVFKTYTFTKTLFDATSSENIFKVFLNPYPVSGIYTPYDTEYQVVTVQ
jgi:hypothetical protein